MTTWQTIFGVETPVVGIPAEVLSARDEFEVRRAAAQGIVDRFASVSSAGSAGRLEGEVGVVFARVVTDVHSGLYDLPRVAAEAYEVFDAHLTALRALRTECNAALARARTAWNTKNDLLGRRPGLESQVSRLRDQIRNAGPDDDVSSLESQLDVADRNLETNGREIDAQDVVLDGVYGTWGSEWDELRRREIDLEHDSAAALRSIDLGDLKDPSWLESAVGAALGFLGGIVESVVNLVEALITGDLATFLWELKALLDVALLILGTIALFTGIGAPLFALAVANLVVSATLYATQLPNPQTGETMGWQGVAWSAAGVVMSSAGFLKNINGAQGWRLFTRTAQRGPGGPGGWVATGPLKPGSIRTFVNNMGHVNKIRTAPISAHGSWQALSTFSKGVRYHTGTPLQHTLMKIDATFSTVWQARGVVNGVANWVPVTTPVHAYTGTSNLSSSIDKLSTGGFSGFNVDNGLGNFFQQGTPVFGPPPPPPPPPTPQQVGAIVDQMAGSPSVHVVPVGS